MHAQSTFITRPSLSHNRAAASSTRLPAPAYALPSLRRRAQLRFWLFVYALLVMLISVTLGAAALLFWWSGNKPISTVPNLSVPVSTQPTGDLSPTKPVSSQPAADLPDQDSTQESDTLGGFASVQPTQVEPTPAEPTPLAAVPAPAQPTQAEPTQESAPVVEPSATPELSEEPTHRQIYLGLEDDYHSQLSVPNGSSACGPAALLIALDYYDLQSSLPDLIAQASFDPQEGGYDSTCTANVVCFSPKAMARLASEAYGLEVQYGEGWSFDQVYEALASGSPVIADIAWDPNRTTLGHFVVIYGVDPEDQMVYYHDPYDGASLSATWEDFSYRWSFTVDVGDPLQGGGYNRWGMAIYMR